uniref:Uncharacterized protein n=1 Tax=Avena sativa TaxID=4498 RepID=A0ACD5YIQ3_AVESA
MADRVHPMPHSQPPHPASPPSPVQEEATETTPLHPAFHGPPAAPPGMYIVQIPKDQILRVPPPDRARLYKTLAGRPGRKRHLRRSCFGACGAVILLLLAAAAFVGAVYLVFRPRAPAFSVSSLSFRDLDASSTQSQLSPALDLAVRADNSKNTKVGVDYRSSGEVSVSYSGTRLAAGAWPAFRQAPRNVTTFSTTLSGTGVIFSDEQRKQLAAEQAARAVPLTVEARVPVRLLFGKVLRTWTVDVKATCEVTVDRLAGEAAAANRGCRVKVRPFLWWWW